MAAPNKHPKNSSLILSEILSRPMELEIIHISIFLELLISRSFLKNVRKGRGRKCVFGGATVGNVNWN